MLDEKPCYIPSSKTYDIIRSYVKQNIDGKYARITSDYDFHFEVAKKIKLMEPTSYTYNANSNDKRRKPNWITKINQDREIPILNLKRLLTDRDYGKNCTMPDAFIGENYNDMIEKMNKYLEDLIQSINEPYKECEHCKGWGVVLDEKN